MEKAHSDNLPLSIAETRAETREFYDFCLDLHGLQGFHSQLRKFAEIAKFTIVNPIKKSPTNHHESIHHEKHHHIFFVDRNPVKSPLNPMKHHH